MIDRIKKDMDTIKEVDARTGAVLQAIMFALMKAPEPEAPIPLQSILDQFAHCNDPDCDCRARDPKEEDVVACIDTLVNKDLCTYELVNKEIVLTNLGARISHLAAYLGLTSIVTAREMLSNLVGGLLGVDIDEVTKPEEDKKRNLH